MTVSESGFRLVNLPGGWRVGRFASLEALPWAAHMVTTRHGPNLSGVSPTNAKPLEAVGDILGSREVAYAQHVHGADVLEVAQGGFAGQADGLVTRQAGLAVTAFSADCVTVLIADPMAQAVGVVHSGWRGTVARAAGNLAGTMTRYFASRPGDLVACIGPSIGPCCFYANPEMIELARKCFGSQADKILQLKGKSMSFDLQTANVLDLLAAGLRRENIHLSGICTYCRTDEFFSYQKDLGPGRICSAIAVVSGK